MLVQGFYKGLTGSHLWVETSSGGDAQTWEDSGSFSSAQEVPGLPSLCTTNLLCDLSQVTAPRRACVYLCGSNFSVSHSWSPSNVWVCSWSCLLLPVSFMERFRRKGKPRPLLLIWSRRCWAVVRGLAEARPAFPCCASQLPHTSPLKSVRAPGEVQSALSAERTHYVQSGRTYQPNPCCLQYKSRGGFAVWIHPIRPMQTAEAWDQQNPVFQNHQPLAL